MPSMGSVGDCDNNAMVESFWSRIQVELLNRRRWNTRIELANAIFDYLEIFHNRQRHHRSLGTLTPDRRERNDASRLSRRREIGFDHSSVRRRRKLRRRPHPPSGPPKAETPAPQKKPSMLPRRGIFDGSP